MGAMKSLIMEIEERVLAGVPFYDIAAEYDIEVEQVKEIALAMYENEQFSDQWHDHMERDHDEPYEYDDCYPDPDAEYESRYELEDF